MALLCVTNRPDGPILNLATLFIFVSHSVSWFLMFTFTPLTDLLPAAMRQL
jgi:hypothetical protein